MDHYKTLGLSRSATKDEIKEAFRRSALKFHPDRHSQSSNEVREGASFKFKQASEAYEVLIDDGKRADYDRTWRGGGGSSHRWSRAAPSSSYYSSSSTYSYRRPPAREDLEILFRLLTRRGFLVGMAFASILVGGAVAADSSLETIWKINNSGKSFEETIQSIEQIKARKENNP